MHYHRWLILIDRLCRWLLAAVFIFAGLPKILNPHEFAQIIDAYGLLPEMLILPVAYILPLAEVVAAFALLRGRVEGLWSIAVMMLCFIAILGYGIHLGLDIDCGCFGPDDPEHLAFSGLRIALIRDLLLCIPLGYGFWYSYGYRAK